MSNIIENGIRKRALYLCALFIYILLIFQIRNNGFVILFFLLSSLIILISFIAIWVHLLFDSTSFSENVRFCLAILEYPFTGEPQPLTITHGVISNDYFLIQSKPDRLILLIRKQSAAIVQDDRKNMHLIGQGIYFLPKEWEIINTFDISIQKVEFGPLLYEDPFSCTQYEESLILQQARNNRLETSKFKTKDNKSIFISGTILYQIFLSEDKSDPSSFIFPIFLKQLVEAHNEDLSSGCITDELNERILLLVTSILRISIRQFTFEELFMTDESHSNRIDIIFKDLNLFFASHVPITKNDFPYFTQDQITSINDKLSNIHFIKHLISITKIHISPENINILQSYNTY